VCQISSRAPFWEDDGRGNAFIAAGVAAAATPTNSSTGISKHQEALQKIAKQNGGTRASSTAGYDASAKYVAD
jgi:hypothetical protein